MLKRFVQEPTNGPTPAVLTVRPGLPRSRLAGIGGGVSQAPGTLYVIATPIGHLGDLTPRAADWLARVDLLLCEDTRHTGGLLRHLGAKTATLSLHAHNEADRISTVLERLRQGQQIGLVSDAGTPCLSDPGERLVAAVHEHRFHVETIPGPFAAAAALAASGHPAVPFSFWGFLAKRKAARRKQLVARLQPAPGGGEMTHIFYIPGRDLAVVSEDLAALVPDAAVTIARELTKSHEGYVRGPAADIGTLLSDEQLCGEAVVLVTIDRDCQPAGDNQGPSVDQRLLQAIESGADRKQALREIARQTGQSRRSLYNRWLELAAKKQP